MLRQRSEIYAQRPPEDDAVLLTVRCWHQTTTCRRVWGASLGPIPWDAVEAWAHANGLDRESAALLHEAIEHVDNERMRLEQAKQNLNKASGGKSR